jgi:hypothetical protein
MKDSAMYLQEWCPKQCQSIYLKVVRVRVLALSDLPILKIKMKIEINYGFVYIHSDVLTRLLQSSTEPSKEDANLYASEWAFYLEISNVTTDTNDLPCSLGNTKSGVFIIGN